MMGLEQIKAENRDAKRRASKAHQLPYVVWEQEVVHFPPFPFPYIGDYRPPGWKLMRRHFVDSSGFGDVGDPALTAEQFRDKLIAGRGYAIIEAGQFQVYVGEFRRVRGEEGAGE